MQPKPNRIKITHRPKQEKPKFLRKRRNNEKLRRLTLERDNYVCQDCLEAYMESELECDHEIPLKDGGLDDLSNTKTRCITCHRVKTNRENNYVNKSKDT